MSQYSKAIVAVLVPLVVQLLGKAGFNLDPTFVDALTVILTGVFVYFVPNSKPAEAA